MRAALYARYSSDLQNPKSADDQIAELRQAAQAKGWTVDGVYKDEAISGASIANRPGLLRLLQHTREGRYDLVFSEALDRISRDQADLGNIFKELSWLKVKVHTVCEGEAGLVHIGLAGIMGQMYLKQLGEKTLRGQIANACRAAIRIRTSVNQDKNGRSCRSVGKA